MRSGPGHLPVTIAVVLLTIGTFFSPTFDDGLRQPGPTMMAESALQSPTFRIEYRSGDLELTGTAGSADHESALAQVIEDQFASPGTRIDLRPGVVLPDGWEAASLRLLYVLGAAKSGVARMEDGRIMMRGVTSDGVTLASRLRFLRESLPAGIEFDEDFIVVEESASLSDLCRTSLANASSEPVEFRHSSARVRTSSYAILDKIIDVANDCRGSRIVITGHTDASGDESWNQHLSLARAQAVADFIVRGGIEPDRLIVAGSGSSEPVADNSTARGRSRNRRIEFEFR
jgi:OOP family OmpA-OmpF porin